jgi:hypothetical protein
MTKRILLIGIDPALLTFNQPQRTAETVVVARVDATEALTGLGYEVTNCIIDLGETAEAKVHSTLSGSPFDVVMIGAALRARVEETLLFEKVINLVHQHAPQARLCFNTRPDNTVEAVKRWL